MRQVRGALAVATANDVLISIFGEAAHHTCRAAYVKNKVLAIACLSSVLVQEIRLREKEIIRTLNHKLGVEEVDKIHCLD